VVVVTVDKVDVEVDVDVDEEFVKIVELNVVLFDAVVVVVL
jgi:hypothetical protein